MQNSDLGIEKIETLVHPINGKLYAPVATQGSSLSPAFVNEVDSNDNILKVTANSRGGTDVFGNKPF